MGGQRDLRAGLHSGRKWRFPKGAVRSSLIDNASYGLWISGMFMLLAVFVGLMQPAHDLVGVQWALLGLCAAACVVLAVAKWSAIHRGRGLRVCFATLICAYMALSLFYMMTFVMACTQFGAGKGMFALLVLGFSCGVVYLAFNSRSRLGRALNGALGGLTTFAGMFVMGSDGGKSFMIFYFSPMTSLVCALLIYVVVKDRW